MKPGARKGLFRSGHHDSNHAEIAAALARFGPEPIDTTKVGAGFPDLVWPFQGHTILVEVKTPEGTLTPAQLRFNSEWRGGPVFIITSADEIPQMVEAIQRHITVIARRPVRG